MVILAIFGISSLQFPNSYLCPIIEVFLTLIFLVIIFQLNDWTCKKQKLKTWYLTLFIIPACQPASCKFKSNIDFFEKMFMAQNQDNEYPWLKAEFFLAWFNEQIWRLDHIQLLILPHSVLERPCNNPNWARIFPGKEHKIMNFLYFENKSCICMYNVSICNFLASNVQLL